jgi:hypothetical protein
MSFHHELPHSKLGVNDQLYSSCDRATNRVEDNVRKNDWNPAKLDTPLGVTVLAAAHCATSCSTSLGRLSFIGNAGHVPCKFVIAVRNHYAQRCLVVGTWHNVWGPQDDIGVRRP